MIKKSLQLLVLFVAFANANFTFVKHILNDTLRSDTVFHRGSLAAPTQATINLVAKSSSNDRQGLNILIASDFSESMKQNAQDTSLPKIFLIRNAVRQFIDSNLQGDDALALMRFINGYQFFPEKEERYKRSSIWYRVRVEAGGKIVLRDTLFPEGCRRYISKKITERYSNCDETYNIAAKLAGRDKYGQIWGRDRFGNVIDSIFINGTGYVLDSVKNDSVLYVVGNPALSSSTTLTFSYVSTNTGQLAPRDELYSDTFHFVPGSLKGAVNEINIGQQYGQNMFSINTKTSYGIERLWWEFCHSGMEGVSSLGADTGSNYNILEPWKQDFSWIWYTNSHLQSRLAGGSTALYYNMWQAVRYALTHNDKAGVPVIIFLTDGTDEASPAAFRRNVIDNPNNSNPFTLPRHFQSIPSDTSYAYVRSQFESFMRDSIGDRVSLYTIVLDTFPGRPDYQTLWRSSNLSSTVDNKHFHMLAGSNLDSVYNLIGQSIRVQVARPIANQPMFVDMLNKVDGARFVAGSLQAGFLNKISFDSVRVDSTGDNYIFKFFCKSLDADAVFDYLYRVEADITVPSLTPKAIVLNPNPLFSRAQYINTTNQTITEPFNKDTLYVKSTVDRLLLSRSQSSFDTTGIGSGSRILSYSRLNKAVDTSITLYSLLRITGSNNSEALLPINSSWSFNPLAWLDDGSRTISMASSLSAKPYAIVNFDSSGANDQTYNLTSRLLNPQTGEWMTAQLSYIAASIGSDDYIDSIVIAVGGSLPSNISNSYTLTGNIDELSLRPPTQLCVLGRSHATGQFSALVGNWSVAAGLTKYPAVIGSINGYSDGCVSFVLSPDMSSPSSQSDSGIVRVTHMNSLGQLKSSTIKIKVIDLTDRSIANSVAIFTREDYLPNQNNPAMLESLFVAYYDHPGRTIIKAPLDTVLEVYSLLFSKRPGFPSKFKGLDTAQSWTVRPGVSVFAPGGSGSSLRYTNHFAPRRDTIEVTSSIDSTRRIMIVWSYGTGRVLHLESRAGRHNDNVTARLVGKDVSLLDQHISSDTVYASLRDEFGNYISYNDNIEWRILNPGYTTYVSFTTGNPSVISKMQNGQQEYSMTATIPAGSNVIGTGSTLASALRDTLRIVLSASGFDAMRLVVSGNSSFTSGGIFYPEFTSPNISSVLDIRAGLLSDSLHPSFTAYIHKIGEMGVLPAGWEQANSSIKWYYTNSAPFVGEPDTQYSVSSIRIKPRYHVAGLVDTLIAEWRYNNQIYRDSIRFRTLPPYATKWAIACRDTVRVGDSSLFSISLRDHNDNMVVDNTVLPKHIKLLASSAELQFKATGSWIVGLDSVFSHSEPIGFSGGISNNYIISLKTGPVLFTAILALKDGDTVTFSKVINFINSNVGSVRVVYGNTMLDCLNDTMDVSAVSGLKVPFKLFDAQLFDVLGNRIINSIESQKIKWSFTGTIDSSAAHASSFMGQLEYNAQGHAVPSSGFIICRYNSSIADSFKLVIIDGRILAEKMSNAIPKSFELSQNHPNPFNPITRISYAIPHDGSMSLCIYSFAGKLLKVVKEGNVQAGYYSSMVNTDSFGSGSYIYRLKLGKSVHTKVMTIIK